MKLLSVLFPLIFSLPAFASPADDFTNQFKAFIGHYKIASCTQTIVEDSTKPPTLNSTCANRNQADIFLGSDYQPTSDFDGLYLTMTVDGDPNTFASAGIADFKMNDGEFCTTAPGIQACSNMSNGSMAVSIYKGSDGIVHLHWTLNWPANSGRGGLINDLYLDLQP